MPAGERNSQLAVSEPDDSGFGGILADLTLAVGSLRESMSRGARPRIPWEACRPVPLLGRIALSGGAGTLDQPDLYGPKDPYWWDLRTVAVWGFTAGTITLYLNDTNGQQLGQTTVPGEFTWSAQKILGPRDRLLFGATGVTGSVNITGQAIEVAAGWLPEYLM